ncbi:isopentenyl phosphate kinase [Pyrofollis japonicus]|uniref:isopentenyl phosphate kinase n=1 Tax=Pyrofollis japonicus TaxID=3060460 RepID=UPI00295B1C79|nr:isopentenyl phosphate kinase [Pyrofollis japonicus]BEP18513.1 isopentenyl phosphate kinase [Pyrofollis japonicus]
MQEGLETRRPRNIYVIKLGGSIITYKNKPFTPNVDLIKRIGNEIADLAVKDIGVGIVIGGGSYGHYAVAIEKENNADARDMIHVVSNAMLELALLVSDILASSGVLTTIFPPHAMCMPRNLNPNCDWRHALRAFQKGITPLTYGDIYPCDNGEGWCIVSGDELAMELACSLGASKVIYVTDVDGILDDEGRVIETLSLNDIRDIYVSASGSTAIDVTGGIKRKLAAIHENWCSNIQEVWIINGHREGSLRALAEGRTYGTRITP